MVLQYARALQYVYFCNDARYKDCWVPAVKNFWAEVIEPFRSWALHNLDPSHLLCNAMCPNWGAKIPDYGVWGHIAHVCAPFFQGIESRSQYKNRRHVNGWRSTDMLKWPQGITVVPSCGPDRRTWEWDK